MNPRPFFILLSSFTLISYAALPLFAGDDEESSEIMELVSETDNCSAKLARNKTATEEEKKEDKKRKRIGIGETVTVTLTSKKPTLLEPKDQIRWKVTQGKGLLEDGLKSENENPDAVTFKINPAINKEQIQQAGKIVIEVETDQGIALPKPMEFDVVFPELLTAEHEKMAGLAEGTPALDMGFPRDGDAKHGASAQLLVSVHPLDVCFEGVYVIEKDKGYQGPVGSLGEPHKADSFWRIQRDNRFDAHDNIGIQPTPEKKWDAVQGIDAQGQPIYKHAYPNEFTWNCLFRTYKFMGKLEGISDIATVYQRFHIESKGNGLFHARIRKFLVDPKKKDECSVERTSGGTHVFKP